MKLLNVFCPNCGAGMKVTENSKVITCEYCNQDFIIYDEMKDFMLKNAEQAGYEFEQGRHRAQKDAGLIPGKTQAVIDNSHKINNLYRLARRAFQEQDYKGAQKYYEQILLEQPDKWEPIFYAAYCKAYDSEIEDIERNVQLLKNKLDSTIIFLKQDNETDKEKEIANIAYLINDLVFHLDTQLVLSLEIHDDPNKDYYEEDRDDVDRHESLLELLDALIIRLAPYTENERIVFYKYRAKEQAVSIMISLVSYKDRVLVDSEDKRFRKRIEKEQLEIAAHNPNYKIEIVPSKGACYVATAVYGSYDCPQVWVLRRFRDEVLLPMCCGRLFVKTYYAVSPTLLKHFGNNTIFKTFCITILDLFIKRLKIKGFSDKPYDYK